jgi:hypothetical protein
MKQNVTRRAAGVFGAAAVAVALACSDSGTSDPLGRSSNSGPSAGVSTDTAPHGGTGNPHDSSGTGNPAPRPVPSFTLAVHVGTPHPTAADTLVNDPLAGATVTVSKFGYIFTSGGGNDTVTITETPVATATTDANGEVSFTNLKGDVSYTVKAEPPAGLALRAARVVLPLAYAPTIRTTLILRKP